MKDGDAEPDQHLDEGEHIQRIIVPLDELHDRLMGTVDFFSFLKTFVACWTLLISCDETAYSKEEGVIVDARYVPLHAATNIY